MTHGGYIMLEECEFLFFKLKNHGLQKMVLKMNHEYRKNVN